MSRGCYFTESGFDCRSGKLLSIQSAFHDKRFISARTLSYVVCDLPIRDNGPNKKGTSILQRKVSASVLQSSLNLGFKRYCSNAILLESPTGV